MPRPSPFASDKPQIGEFMRIKNVLKYTEDYHFTPGSITISGERFIEGREAEDEALLDGEGCYAVPGLIDIHFHGCMGADFCDGTVKAIETLAAYEASIGVTAICPATMTIAKEDLLHVARAAKQYCDSLSPTAPYASFVGINMEGPFISPEKKGAQSSTHISPCNGDFFQEMQKASGNRIRLVDLAPEEKGALPFIDQFKEKVCISLAHTTADYDTAKEAFGHGARHVTHLFNAMPPFTHRAPGVIGAARDASHVMAEIICDGVHIHPSSVRAAFAMFGAERLILISDSMRATGMPDGAYTLGGQAVTVKGNVATLTQGGALAGSVTNLADCLRTVVQKMKIPLEDALRCATCNPARAIGIEQEYGSISPGKYADLLLLDKDLKLKKVFLHGREIPI